MMRRAKMKMLADRRLRLGHHPLPLPATEGDAGQSKVGLGIHRVEFDHGCIVALGPVPVPLP